MAIREYKSNLFSMLLQQPRYALEVYNALNNSNFTDENEVIIYRLENGISLSVRNDASFLLDNNLSIYEQQASVNPNMPLRGLIYLADLLGRYVSENGLDIFGTKLINIPNPRFVVFYNGRTNQPETVQYDLADAFINQGAPADISLKCIAYNINSGMNESLKSKSPVLCEYMEFVDRVRRKGPYTDKGQLQEALEETVKEFIKENRLKEFFEENGDTVIEVETLDFTFEKREKLIYKNAHAEGVAEGLAEGVKMGIQQGIINMLKAGKTPEQIADFCGYDINDVKKIESELKVPN